jgi:hypothetical protein
MTMTDPAIDYWWEPRLAGEPTCEYLARVLRELGAASLADLARRCHFDDYLCPDDHAFQGNVQRLVVPLWAWAAQRDLRPEAKARALQLADGVMAGEFDGTLMEALEFVARTDSGVRR